MNINTIGLDIAKTTFHYVGLDKHGKQVHRKKLRRKQLLSYFANFPACTVVMEACSGAYYWQREFIKLGHKDTLQKIRLI